MKALPSTLTLALTLALGFGLFACGADDSKKKDSSSTTWSNTAMQSIVNNQCAAAGCHDGTQSPKYKDISESAMKADTQALTEVQAGRMPQSGPLSASDKATFVAFFQ